MYSSLFPKGFSKGFCRARPDKILGSPLDELDLVAVGVLDKGDHGGAVLHRSGLARDLAATPLHLLARLAGVGD